MDRASDTRIPQPRVDQPRASGRVVVSPEHLDHPAVGRGTHVPDDAAGPRGCHAAAEQRSLGRWWPWVTRAAACLILAAPHIAPAQDTAAEAGGAPGVDAWAPWGSDVSPSSGDDADMLSAQGWRLDVVAPEPLDELLRNYLDIARFQRESAEPGAIHISRAELRRLVVSAPEQARGLIDAEGYFGARIGTRVTDGLDGQPIVVTLTVEPGQLTRVSKVQFVYEGELDARLDDGEPAARALVGA